MWHPKNAEPAVLHIWDIAGLVQRVSEGVGLGNAFLTQWVNSRDLEHVEGQMQRHEEASDEIIILETVKENLEAGIMVKDAKWNVQRVEVISRYFFADC